MTIPEVYFGAADRQMEGFLQPHSFDRHFLFSILFQGNLVIPDIFFYISNHIRNRVLNKESSIFNVALSEGIIIPSFRSNQQGSFRLNLEEIYDQKIQGIQVDAVKIASILDEKAQDNNKYAYQRWPDVMLSEGFERTSKQALLNSNSHSEDPEFQKLWEETKELRERCVLEASDLSLGKGLRRGTSFNAVAAYFGFQNEEVEDVNALINKIEDPTNRNVAKRILKWVNYCYHFNQGKMFDLQPSLPELDHFDVIFSENFYSNNNDTLPCDELLQKTIEIPSPSQLLTVNPTILFEMRNGEAGLKYFKNLREWQSAPSDISAEKLLISLESYSQEIKSIYIKHGKNILRPRHLLQANVPVKNSQWAPFLLDRTIALVETFAFPVGILGFVTDTVSCGYYLFPEKVKGFIDSILGIKHVVDFEFEQNRKLIKCSRAKLSVDSRFT